MISFPPVVYKEVLPCDAPPTYRGHLLKYAYKITIGTQRLGAPTKLLRIPFRVIVLQGNYSVCACFFFFFVTIIWNLMFMICREELSCENFWWELAWIAFLIRSKCDITPNTFTGLSEACVYSESGELAPTNPFLHTPQRDTPRHTAFQIIQVPAS